MQMLKGSGTNFTGLGGTSYTASGDVEYCDVALALRNGWQPNDSSNNPGALITATVAAGGAVALTSATAANVKSISVPPGTWDLAGVVDYTVGATTTITLMAAGFSTTSATMPTQPGGSGLGTDPLSSWAQASAAPGANPLSLEVGPTRYTNTTTGAVTVYLVTKCTFATSTLAAYGTITARPVK